MDSTSHNTVTIDDEDQYANIDLLIIQAETEKKNQKQTGETTHYQGQTHGEEKMDDGEENKANRMETKANLVGASAIGVQGILEIASANTQMERKIPLSTNQVDQDVEIVEGHEHSSLKDGVKARQPLGNSELFPNSVVQIISLTPNQLDDQPEVSSIVKLSPLTKDKLQLLEIVNDQEPTFKKMELENANEDLPYESQKMEKFKVSPVDNQLMEWHLSQLNPQKRYEEGEIINQSENMANFIDTKQNEQPKEQLQSQLQQIQNKSGLSSPLQPTELYWKIRGQQQESLPANENKEDILKLLRFHGFKEEDSQQQVNQILPENRDQPIIQPQPIVRALPGHPEVEQQMDIEPDHSLEVTETHLEKKQNCPTENDQEQHKGEQITQMPNEMQKKDKPTNNHFSIEILQQIMELGEEDMKTAICQYFEYSREYIENMTVEELKDSIRLAIQEHSVENAQSTQNQGQPQLHTIKENQEEGQRGQTFHLDQQRIEELVNQGIPINHGEPQLQQTQVVIQEYVRTAELNQGAQNVEEAGQNSVQIVEDAPLVQEISILQGQVQMNPLRLRLLQKMPDSVYELSLLSDEELQKMFKDTLDQMNAQNLERTEQKTLANAQSLNRKEEQQGQQQENEMNLQGQTNSFDQTKMPLEETQRKENELEIRRGEQEEKIRNESTQNQLIAIQRKQSEENMMRHLINERMPALKQYIADVNGEDLRRIYYDIIEQQISRNNANNAQTNRTSQVKAHKSTEQTQQKQYVVSQHNIQLPVQRNEVKIVDLVEKKPLKNLVAQKQTMMAANQIRKLLIQKMPNFRSDINALSDEQLYEMYQQSYNGQEKDNRKEGNKEKNLLKNKSQLKEKQPSKEKKLDRIQVISPQETPVIALTLSKMPKISSPSIEINVDEDGSNKVTNKVQMNTPLNKSKVHSESNGNGQSHSEIQPQTTSQIQNKATEVFDISTVSGGKKRTRTMLIHIQEDDDGERLPLQQLRKMGNTDSTANVNPVLSMLQSILATIIQTQQK